MQIISNTTEFNIDAPTVISIGKFDGDHIGHQYIMKTLREVAKDKALKKLVFSFYTAPKGVLGGMMDNAIDTMEQRREKLEAEGIDILIEYPFNQQIASTTGEDFVNDVLLSKCNMKAIVGGTDLTFGKDRSGNPELLYNMSKDCGFDVYILDKIKDTSGEDVSSTLIRDYISKGDIITAERLLGRALSK